MGRGGHGVTRAVGWLALVLIPLLTAPAAHAQSWNVWRGPGGMAVSPDGRNVYVSGRQGLLTLSRSPADGSLSLAGYNRERLGGFVAIAPDGSSVYSSVDTSYPAGGVKAYRRGAGGALTPIAVDESRGRAIGAMDAAISPLGDRLYTPSPYGGMGVYRRSPGGELTLTDRVTTAGSPAMSGPLTVDGAGRLYAGTGYFAEEIAVYAPSGDTVTLLQSVPCSCSSQPTMLIGDEGRRLLLGARDALARDPATGLLGSKVVGWGATLGPPIDFGPMAAIGRSHYLLEEDALHHARFASDSWQVLRTWRNGSGAPAGLTHAKSLAVAPDGRNVYVAAGDTNDEGPPGTVAVFSRNPETGDLSFHSLFVGPHPQPTARVSINGGARYTNTPRVRVSVLPAGGGVTLSNDGGFLRPGFFSPRSDGAYPWMLAAAGRERLPKTVYARSDGVTARDTIVLDTRDPAVAAVRRSAARRGRDRLRVRARDAVSGVSRVQITTKRRKPGRWRVYSVKSRHSVPARRKLYVRVRDRAGNRSKWRAVSRRGHKVRR